MAPKVKPVDTELIEKLAAINCSMEEIAHAVKLNRRTLQRRYAAVIEKGRSTGKTSLKRKMWETAMNGNITMMIWLSKQMLGYADKVENKTDLKQEGTVYRVGFEGEEAYPTQINGAANPDPSKLS